MSRYLFVTWAGGGNVNPVLGLVAALRAGGHDVAAVTAGGNASRLEAAGIAVVASGGGWLPGAGDVLGAVGRYAPDAVVVDYMATDALAARDRFGCPAIALVHTLYIQLLVDGAPSPMAMAGSVDDVNVTRATLGLAPVACLAELLTACDLVLVAVPRALDANGDVPAGVIYVGPLFEAPGPDRSWRPPPGDGPLVVVSAGTAGDPHAEVDLLRRVAAALAVLPVRGFVTVPDYVDSSRIEWPANVASSGYVRHSAVLPHADLLVTHGGLGSVTAALAHGVPMVCLPLGREQPDNAAAVARLGAGRALPSDASPRAIAAAVAAELERREPVRCEPDPAAAAEWCERVVAGRRSAG